MKKTVLLLVAVFVCSLASAQVLTSTSYTTVKRAKEKTVWYVKAGATFANMGSWDEDYDDFDTSSLLGYNIGIAFDKPIGHHGWFWNSGLQLGRKGFKYSKYGYEYKLKTNKIELPLTLGYKIGISDDLTVDIRVGGFVNFDLWGKMNCKDDEGNEWSLSLTDLCDEGAWGDEWDYIRFGGGITAAVGVWYQQFNLNLCYQYGLVDATLYGGYERNLMISVGYAF